MFKSGEEDLNVRGEQENCSTSLFSFSVGGKKEKNCTYLAGLSRAALDSCTGSLYTTWTLKMYLKVSGAEGSCYTAQKKKYVG